MRMVDRGVAMKFDELFSSAATRSELVVTFLAILELIRMRQFSVRQELQFGEIWLERTLLSDEELSLPDHSHE